MARYPRESSRLISELSKDVKICENHIENAAKQIIEGFSEENYDLKKWKEHDQHPKTMDKSTVDWIFLIDTLNFSFWAEKGKEFKVAYKNKSYTGYPAICAAVNRALEEGYPLLSAEYFSTISLETLKHILRSDTEHEMPLIEERQKVLQSTGKCLIEKFGGTFTNCIDSCNKSAKKLLELIVENFSSYKDEATIEGHKVSFYKRAQIVIGDIWACFEGKSYGEFTDIDFITIFADYRIPQVLIHFGVLEYSEKLMQRLKEDKLLTNGERYEVEIRGCSIWAVELLCQAIKKQENKSSVIYNSITVDNYLWDYRRNHAKELEHIPFHKVRCIYY